MKSFFLASLATVIGVAATGLFVGGCTAPTTDDDAAKATKAAAPTVAATPPPNLNVPALQAQQSAAQKASEEARKKYESGK